MKRPLAAVCLAFILLTAVRVWLHPPAYASYGKASGGEVYLTGHVYAKEYKGSHGAPVLIIYVKPKELLFQKESIPFSDNFICILQDGSREPVIGSLVTVRGILEMYEPAANPGQFDERSYYAALGISARINRAETIAEDGGRKVLKEALWKCRVFLGKGLEKIFDGRDAALLKGMLLGDRNAMDAGTKKLYQKAGIMHIFAVSGLHITLLGMGLYRLLGKIHAPVVPSACLSGSIMVLYGMMIGFPVSSMRAIGMFLLWLTAKCIGRTYDAPTALSVCAAFLLAGHPRYLYHAGFLLSFSAVYGAAVLKPAIQPCRKLSPLSDSFFMAFAIAVFTLPVQLYFYYETPVYAMFFNLAVIPLAGIALVSGAAALVLSFLLPSAAALPAYLVHLVFSSYEAGGNFFGALPANLWTAGKPALWQMLGFYLLIGFILLGKKLRWRYKAGLLCGALLLFGIKDREGLCITFLDVGQGDCVCIELPDGGVWLYDGGSTSVSGVGTCRIEPFLKSKGITRLDAVFVSHADEDHMNGVEELLREGSTEIALLGLPCTEAQKDGFAGLLALARERQIPVLWLEAGMEWQSGEVSMGCLHPDRAFGWNDTNAASAVLSLSYGSFSMLLSGDVEGKGEEALLRQLQSEGIEKLSVLKVAHHGSRYATGEAFLEYTTPQFAIISAGQNNGYGHPHKELLARLAVCGADVMVTYETGAVIVRTDGERMRIKGFLGD